jgi:hypothetical protein
MRDGLIALLTVGAMLTAGCAAITKKPRPGTSAHPLGLGQPHVFDWNSEGGKLEMTPLKVEQGRISDLADYDLSPADKKLTPFYLRLRFRNAGKGPLGTVDFGDNTHMQLLDAAERPLHGLTLINLFDSSRRLPCAGTKSPANWPTGATADSCTIFLGAPNAAPASLAYSVEVMSSLMIPSHLVWWNIG